MRDIQTRIDHDTTALRFQYALNLSRFMGFGAGGLIPVILIGLWMVYPEQTRLLAVAAVLSVLLVGWGPYEWFYRRQRARQGIYLGMASFIFAAAVVPGLLPTIFPAASIGYIVLMAMGYLLLGQKPGLVIFALMIPIFLANLIVVRDGLDLPLPPLDAEIANNAGIAVSMMALLIGGLIIRSIVVRQDEQFRRAQQATYEIEQRALTEQAQREQLAAVNRELEYQMAVDRERREYLEHLINQITDAIHVLNSASMEIQAAATQQMASVTEQNATITQTAATVEQVRITAAETAQRAQIVASTSRDSMQVSDAGKRAVADTIEGMQLIRQRVDAIAHTILTLSESTQQIGEIIETVDQLADQLKLLALNASIEAARAGAEGRGFGVVALEVRQLAEQSRQATGRVAAILHEIQKTTNEAVMVTEQGSKGADQGLLLVEQAGAAIQKLTAVIEEAAQVAMQIAASTHQQTTGMDQLAQAMNQIRLVSSQTAASTNQTEQHVRELNEMAQALKETAARYEISAD